ncbi:MAG: extracellular solute-binding protein [Calditrichae bacterium]|nr:extracellular solute-binding protein [Calditrichia bacterium]
MEEKKRSILNERSSWVVGSIILLVIVIILAQQRGQGVFGGNNTATQIYFVDNISQAHSELINRFNAEYSGRIEVVPVDLPFEKFSTNERKQVLAKSLRSKSDRIDVFAIDLIWGARFARWAEPLNPYFTIYERNKSLEVALESCYYKEDLIAAPFYIDVGLMYFRTDLLKKFPGGDSLAHKLRQSLTWSEFIELSNKMPQMRPFYAFSAKNFEGLVCSFMEPLLSQNPEIFNRDSIQLDTPEARKSLQMLVDLVHKYHLAPKEITRFDEVQTYFYALDNDIPFFRGWPGLIRHYRNSPYSEKLQFLEPCALPHLDGKKPASVFGGWNLMVSRFSTKKREAVEFIKFVLREESQRLLFEQGGYIPISKSVYQDSVYFSEHQDLKYYHQLLKNGIHRPFLVNYTKISDVLSYYIQRAIKNEISVEEALRLATRDINSQTMRIN